MCKIVYSSHWILTVKQCSYGNLACLLKQSGVLWLIFCCTCSNYIFLGLCWIYQQSLYLLYIIEEEKNPNHEHPETWMVSPLWSYFISMWYGASALTTEIGRDSQWALAEIKRFHPYSFTHVSSQIRSIDQHLILNPETFLGFIRNYG